MRNQQRSAAETEGRHSPRSLTLNLTAMIDVVFLLLVYFVLSVAFSRGEGVLTATFPACGGCGEPDRLRINVPLRVSISTAGAQGDGYRLDIDRAATAPRTFGELAQTLEKMHVRRGGYLPADTQIILAPANAVRWQHVVNAFNAALRARYTNIAFAQATNWPQPRHRNATWIR